MPGNQNTLDEIRDELVRLLKLAQAEQFEVLAYLLSCAFEEAKDIEARAKARPPS